MRSTANAGFDIREAVENLRDALSPRSGGSSSRDHEHGDVRGAILAALAHEPMNGHQVIQAIAATSGGEWKPSASQVYPTLQQLSDEGFVTASQDGERTVYSLTEAGRAAAAEAHAEHATHGRHDGSQHDNWKMPRWDDHSAAVPKAGAKLAQAAAQVAQSGTREQKERAAALLDDTRRKLYAILAEG